MLKIENVKISDIIPYKHNAKQHPAEQVAQIAASIRQFGMNDPVAIDEDNVIIEGHGRLLAIQKMQAAGEYTEETVPCIRLDGLTDEQRRAYMLVHNKLTMNSGFDIDLLNIELDNITNIDMRDFGFEFELESEFKPEEEAKGSMREKYLVPPFSVIYCNRPDWLARKRAWVDIGIRSEIGRFDKLVYNPKSNPEANFLTKRSEEGKRSKAYADGLIEKRESIRKGTYHGRSI